MPGVTRVWRGLDVVPTGLAFGAVRWGTHLCHFYQTGHDLAEVGAPFCEAGVAHRERCIWIANAQLPAARARAVLAGRVPDLDERIAAGQVAIVDRADWLSGGTDDIAGWIEREQLALADGFAGLRITGSTWSEPAAWRELAAHETRLHRALHGRRITALCSYQLDRCGPYEILDVLRHHESALMRRDGVWEHVRSAPAALALASAPKHHTVEFFAGRDFPATSIARRFADALDKDRAAVALCGRDHLARLRAAIAHRGDSRLLLVDADAVFEALVDGDAFEAAMDVAIGAPIRALVAKHRTAQIYTEIVDVCCRRGRRDLAVRIERWWNRLLEHQFVELHCGYTFAAFDDAQSIQDFRAICDEHVHAFARSQLHVPDANRIAVELQQVSAILECEAAKRAVAESEARVSREHLAVLQQVTSALGEAVSFDDVGAVATFEIGHAVGATQVGLVIGGQLISPPEGTTPEDMTTIAHLIEHLPAQWSAGAELAPEIAWIGGALVAVLPLVIADDRIGTLLLGFDKPALATTERALVDDLVRQLAFAVERARVYEQATQDRVRAERATAVRDQFIAMLGHELRNPLSPILSATQLMRLRAPDQLVKERATIERNVTQMIGLVDDLLGAAQIARGELALSREPTELYEVVQEAVEAARPVVDDQMRFAVAIPSGLVVDVDRARLRQVLVNLIVNAAKAEVDRAGVEIAARPAGDGVELIVRDEANGIAPELAPYVFDLFVQGRRGLDRARGGLGIGLPLARTIVELHGGTISMTSEGAGTGATFTIALPRVQLGRSTDQIAIPTPPPGIRRILVVDDNEDAAWLLAEALRVLGHEVRVAHDGLSALALARDWEPEVAVLDLGLPGMDGFELCRELAKLPRRPYTIAVSGYGQARDRALAREAGFHAHFVKPVDLRDVQTAIEALSHSN